jgi:hypothetical protein
MIVLLSFWCAGSQRTVTAFLQRPGVAVRVGEVGETGVVATLGIQPARA